MVTVNCPLIRLIWDTKSQENLKIQIQKFLELTNQQINMSLVTVETVSFSIKHSPKHTNICKQKKEPKEIFSIQNMHKIQVTTLRMRSWRMKSVHLNRYLKLVQELSRKKMLIIKKLTVKIALNLKSVQIQRLVLHQQVKNQEKHYHLPAVKIKDWSQCKIVPENKNKFRM